MGKKDGEPGTTSGGITEQPNPRTRDLDRLPLEVVLERILDEDGTVPGAVRAALPQILRAAEVLIEVLQGEGRWFNLGAGTSGRLGVLDAAEIPPTFGLEPHRVQGVIAGGPSALERAVERAEDDPDSAADDLAARGFGSGDVLVALSTSGRTPYALGAIRHAKRLGARTIGITCNSDSPLADQVEIPIVVTVGPEVIAGSTRLKGGLAQKMVLHTLSTAVMVQLGRVYGNLMSDIQASTSKLRDRALTILMRIGPLERVEAERLLVEAGGSLRRALDLLEREG
jgi:N-acetylmuramic acid 6-phosphate etherase